jgi:dethiobiotin synthetase
VIVAVSGTGTGVGKTHIACALVAGLRDRGMDVVGWKPVESGVGGHPGAPGEDEALLQRANGGIAVPPTVRLREPLSPHLAARREGIAIESAALHATLENLDRRHAIVVVELAGGLFSPFDDHLDNAEWIGDLEPRTIVVAPDRLGVLHDCGAVVRAALAVHAIVLSPPERADASSGTNATELRARPRLAGIPIVAVARAPIDVLRRDDALIALAMP